MVTVRPQLSASAVAVPELPGAVESPQASTLSAGQWTVGAVLSAKLMCCTQLLVLRQASDAYQVRSIPCLPVQLAAVAASLEAMVTVPPQLSASAGAVPVFP